MKKFLTVILATLVLSCSAACGTPASNDTSSVTEVSSSTQDSIVSSETEESKTEEIEEEAESVFEEEDESSASEDKMETIHDYLNLPSVQETIKETQEQYADTALVDLFAEDNKLIYSFTLNEQMDEEEISIFASSIDTQMESLGGLYSGIAGSINTMLDRDDTIVVVRYSNADGSVAWEKEYTEE